MRTTNRFDPAAFKVPEMSPENESETSANGEKSKTLVFSYLRVSLLGKVKSGRFYLAMFQHYHLPVFALGCPLWEIRSFNDRGITITISARALIMPCLRFSEDRSISSRVWSVICSLFLSRPCEASHKTTREGSTLLCYLVPWGPEP